MIERPAYPPIKMVNYTLKQGDNLWDVSRKLGMNIDTIVSANRVKKVHVVPVGMSLFIPVFDGIRYRVNSNESRAQIAKKYFVDKKAVLPFRIPVRISNSSPQKEFFILEASFTLAQRLEKLGTLFLNPLPKNKYRITALMGNRRHPITKKRSFHAGIDLGAPLGTPVYSAMGGKVIQCSSSPGYGKIVVIQHKKGYKTKYAHLSKIRIKLGQRVSAQIPIGNVGNTGTSTGPHLHFEVLRNNKPIDPRGITDFH